MPILTPEDLQLLESSSTSLEALLSEKSLRELLGCIISHQALYSNAYFSKIYEEQKKQTALLEQILKACPDGHVDTRTQQAVL